MAVDGLLTLTEQRRSRCALVRRLTSETGFENARIPAGPADDDVGFGLAVGDELEPVVHRRTQARLGHVAAIGVGTIDVQSTGVGTARDETPRADRARRRARRNGDRPEHVIGRGLPRISAPSSR